MDNGCYRCFAPRCNVTGTVRSINPSTIAIRAPELAILKVAKIAESAVISREFQIARSRTPAGARLSCAAVPLSPGRMRATRRRAARPRHIRFARRIWDSSELSAMEAAELRRRSRRSARPLPVRQFFGCETRGPLAGCIACSWHEGPLHRTRGDDNHPALLCERATMATIIVAYFFCLAQTPKDWRIGKIP